MPCPVCGGSKRIVVGPSAYVCTTQRVVDGVAPGDQGNVGVVPVPIYGECRTRYEAADEQARAATEEAREGARAEARAAWHSDLAA
jgi:hypothetical protein